MNKDNSERKGPKKKRGRPLRSEAPMSHTFTIRLMGNDLALLQALKKQQEEAASRLGIAISTADVLRFALRREAERCGLLVHPKKPSESESLEVVGENEAKSTP